VILSLITAYSAVSLAETAGEKTLSRKTDPVVIKGESLPGMGGVAPSSLSLMAYRGGEWSLVPFQIDQVKPDGTYALASGKMAGPDSDPMLDSDDELVFMARDSGDRRLSVASLPEGAILGVEIEVKDPLDGGMGWLYLFRFESSPPRSAADYISVTFDKETGYRWAESKEIKVGMPADRVYPEYISNRTLVSGEEGDDVLDRLKIRGVLVFPLGIEIPIAAEQMIYARPLGYTDGPVRVIEFVDGYMKVAGIEFKGIGASTLSYYEDHVLVPVTIAAASKVPDWLLKFIPESRLYGYMDFNENVYGSYVFSAANPVHEDVVLDGKTSEAEKNLDREAEVDWLAGHGPQGGLVFRLILEGDSGELSKMTTYYVDDNTAEDPPEEVPGMSAVGFHITGATDSLSRDVVRRSADFSLYAYGKNDLTEDNVYEVLNVLDYPLTVETRVVGL